jgi:hypothetical protein
MKTVVGTVVSLNLNTQVAKNGGGTYPGWELVYRGTDGKVDTIAKHANSLKFSPTLKAALEGLAVNDEFTVELEKGDKGFWEIVSISKGTNLPAQTAAQRREASTSTTSEPRYKSDKTNTYETPEERALRQALIVRQSSVTTAQAMLGSKASAADIFKLASEVENFVWAGYEDRKAPTTGGDAAEVD